MASAQEPPQILAVVPVRHLTLEEAKQLAAANNKSIALAQLNVLEKQHVTNAAGKDYLPKLLGNVSYFHFNQDLGSVVSVQKGTHGFLPPGVLTIGVPVLNENSTLSTLMVAQPITKLIAVNAAVQIARADQAAAQAQLDKGLRDLLSGVAQAYYGLLGLQRIQAALELQIGMLEKFAVAKPSPELRIGLVEARQGLLEVQPSARPDRTVAGYSAWSTWRNSFGFGGSRSHGPPRALRRRGRTTGHRLQFGSSRGRAIYCQSHGGLASGENGLHPRCRQRGWRLHANQTAASYIQPNIGYVGVTARLHFLGLG